MNDNNDDDENHTYLDHQKKSGTVRDHEKAPIRFDLSSHSHEQRIGRLGEDERPRWPAKRSTSSII